MTYFAISDFIFWQRLREGRSDDCNDFGIAVLAVLLAIEENELGAVTAQIRIDAQGIAVILSKARSQAGLRTAFPAFSEAEQRRCCRR